MGKFVNQIEVLSKLRNLEGFIQEFTQNIMALDLKLEDTFTFKQGEKKIRDKMILSLYRKGKINIQDIAEYAEVSVQYVNELIASSQNELAVDKIERKNIRKSNAKN